MKRLIALITMFALLLGMLCACGSVPEQSVANEETPVVNDTPVAEQDTPSIPQELSKNDAFATTSEDLTLKLQELIDLSQYEIDEYDADITFDLENDFDFTFNFDYIISFDDNSSITLPIAFADMENTAWTTEAAADFPVYNTIQRGIPYTNNGQEITLWTTNLDAIDSDEDVSCPLSDCMFYQINIDLYTVETETDENGEYIDFYQMNPKAPAFTVFGSVNPNSTIEDVISTIGAPSIIDFHADSNEIELGYMYKSEKGFSNAYFTFAADGNYMVSMSYKYAI